jgi:hypothetical protein
VQANLLPLHLKKNNSTCDDVVSEHQGNQQHGLRMPSMSTGGAPIKAIT